MRRIRQRDARRSGRWINDSKALYFFGILQITYTFSFSAPSAMSRYLAYVLCCAPVLADLSSHSAQTNQGILDEKKESCSLYRGILSKSAPRPGSRSRSRRELRRRDDCLRSDRPNRNFCCERNAAQMKVAINASKHQSPKSPNRRLAGSRVHVHRKN